jgi:hypothetical protein
MEEYPDTNALLIQDIHTSQEVVRMASEVELYLGYAPWNISVGDSVIYQDNYTGRAE